MNFFDTKKRMCSIIAGCILVLSFICVKLEVVENVLTVFQEKNLKNTKELDQYTIAVDFDPVEKILEGHQKITYTNRSHVSFDAVYFHLYPNAFKKEDDVPFEKSEMEEAYPTGFESGYIDIHSVKNNDKNLNYTVMGKGSSILRVSLSKPLDPSEKIDLELKFTVKIPPSCGRFGYGENTINIANWYPVVSVFDSQGWNLDPYHAIGDPFYSDASNYRVEILVPEEYILAHSGNCIKKENINGKIRWTIEEKNIRDFAMIASDKFKVMETSVDGVKIYSYYIKDECKDVALGAAKDSIKIFNQFYGKYPYKQFSVAEADFFIGGMEYPNLVFIDQALYEERNKQILEYVIVHEAAHQWWYGIVGNDEVDEPWLDEALTEYSTLLYYEKKYGAKIKEQVYKTLIEKRYNSYMDRHKNKELTVYRGINEFKDSLEYQMLVYYKGSMFVRSLRKELGDELFFKSMKVYFDKYKYKNAKTEDFIRVCENVSNKSLREKFEKWLGYKKE